MEENNQIDETNQAEKVVISLTPEKTTTPVRRTATRKPVVKKVVEVKPVLTTTRPVRVRKPIEKKPTEEINPSSDSITVTIADESGNDIVDEVTPANQETKKLEKNNIKKLNKMSKKITEKEKKEKAKQKEKQAVAKAKQKEKEKKAKKKKKEKAKKEKAKMKLKVKAAKKKAASKKKKAKAKSKKK